MRKPADAKACFTVRIGGCVGAVTGVKLEALVTVPAGVVTLIGPAVAPAGTMAVIWVAELTVKEALTPLNITEVAPLRLLPVMMIEAPTVALAGIAPMLGGGAAVGANVRSVIDKGARS